MVIEWQHFSRPTVASFLVGIFVFPLFIRWQESWGVGQKIKKEGPNLHLHKENTPTMGGVVIVAATFLGLLAGGYFDGRGRDIFIFSLFFFLLGFWDDFFKSFLKKPWGIKARYKFFYQLLGGAGILLWGARFFPHQVILPFSARVVELGPVAFFLYGLLVIVASANAFNIVDGLDGLAGGCGVLSFAFFTLLFLESGRPEFAGFSGAIIGALLAFLWFNFWPARIFMGDSGSLPLGALMGVLSLVSGHSLFLIPAGIIFVIDTLSVVLQVASFQLFRRRIFLMSPLHHHFELRGMKESQITIRFWIVQFLGVLCAFWGMGG
ncbi:MAG: phospho-N-acetylmuramoyl-pentapeptide-transferase [Candidatus Caldatribacteriaceae bacterium]